MPQTTSRPKKGKSRVSESTQRRRKEDEQLRRLHSQAYMESVSELERAVARTTLDCGTSRLVRSQ